MSKIMKGGDAVELSTDINVITAEINSYKQIAGQAIFEIGKRLKAVRDADKDSGNADERNLAEQRSRAGGWIKWLSEHVDFTRQYAHKFIKVYEMVKDDDVNPGLHKQSLKALYEIATLPPEQREKEHTLKSGETKTVDEMTVTELREVKKALKEKEEQLQSERERRLKAECDYETIVQSIEQQQQQPHEQPQYENVTRIDTSTEINGTALGFSTSVRNVIKEFSFLQNYKSTFVSMNDISREEYEKSLDALINFATSIRRELQFTRQGDVIIEMEE